MRRWINLIEEGVANHYIRFGDIPENERSQIGQSPNFIKHATRRSDEEIGVSVFDAEWSDELNRWEIVNVGNFASLDALLGQHRPTFLVRGKVVGHGIDDETLLRNVKIVSPLRYDQLWVRGWGADGACEAF